MVTKESRLVEISTFFQNHRVAHLLSFVWIFPSLSTENPASHEPSQHNSVSGIVLVFHLELLCLRESLSSGEIEVTGHLTQSVQQWEGNVILKPSDQK